MIKHLKKSWIQKIILIIFGLGLFYILMPGSSSIDDFPPLPDSTKSELEGDTIQNPNIVAYFSDFRRDFITSYYCQYFAKLNLFIGFIPPIKINHPPEKAYQYIRDQQESTFLEEYVYPLRGAIFVNGYEPLVENTMYKRADGYVGNHIWYQEVPYNSKTTLRFYPTNIFQRLFIYFAIWGVCFCLYKLLVKILKEY